MNNAMVIGVGFGVALGFAAGFGGFTAFVAVLLFGGIGLLVGAWLDGRVDLSALFVTHRDRR